MKKINSATHCDLCGVYVHHATKSIVRLKDVFSQIDYIYNIDFIICVPVICNDCAENIVHNNIFTSLFHQYLISMKELSNLNDKDTYEILMDVDKYEGTHIIFRGIRYCFKNMDNFFTIIKGLNKKALKKHFNIIKKIRALYIETHIENIIHRLDVEVIIAKGKKKGSFSRNSLAKISSRNKYAVDRFLKDKPHLQKYENLNSAIYQIRNNI